MQGQLRIFADGGVTLVSSAEFSRKFPGDDLKKKEMDGLFDRQFKEGGELARILLRANKLLKLE
jgi:hypothetical protein